MRTNIAEKVQSILDEIEAGSLSEQVSGGMTAQEIAQILSGVSAPQGEPETDANGLQQKTPDFAMDYPAMEQARLAANERWELHYYRPIYSCRKFIGRGIVFGKRVVRKLLKFLLEPLVEEQNNFNSAVTQAINAVRNNDITFQAAINYLNGEWIKNAHDLDLLRSELAQNISKLQDELEQSKQASRDEYAQFVEVLRNELEQSKQASRDEYVQLVEVLRNELEQSKQALRDEYAQLVGALRDETVQLHVEYQDISAKVGQITARQEEDNVYSSIDYFAFQEQMRGSFTEIKKRQFSYLTYYEGCTSVIDLGCGRGEFVELLQEHGIGATGVDLYTKSVQFCRSRGLNVVEQDAVAFLKEQKEESADGIFSAQLVEHISAGQILEICRESYRVLKPGSYLVIETPNPMCLSTYMNSFYLDPSHKNPVHPHLMEYFLRECGYSNIKIVFTQASKSGYRLPLLNVENCKNLAEFNDGVNFLSDIIFGSTDYAIIAQK